MKQEDGEADSGQKIMKERIEERGKKRRWRGGGLSLLHWM